MTTDGFDLAIKAVLEREGGFVNNPADPGGATNFGISIRFLKTAKPPFDLSHFDFDHDGDFDAQDMKLLPKEEAVEVYRKCFWDRYGYGRLTGAGIATKVLDIAVNMGPREAASIVQRAVNNIAGKQVLKEDGDLGPLSVVAANACPSDTLLAWLRTEQKLVYDAIIDHNPTSECFRKGWYRRAAM